MLPLEGYKVGVTADRRAHEQIEYLFAQGATVLHAPTAQTVLADSSTLRDVTVRLIDDPPDLLVTTSSVGIRSWMTHMTSWGLDADLRKSLRETKILAVGPETVGELAAADLHAALKVESDPREVAEILERECGSAKRVAVQLDGEASTDLVRLLEQSGKTVETLTTHRSQLPDDRGPAAALIKAACRRTLHAITFTTAASVRGAFAIAAELDLESAVRDSFQSVIAACGGPQAAAAARDAGIEEPFVPELPRVAYLLRDLTVTLEKMRRTLATDKSSAIVQGGLVCVDGEPIVLSARERMLFDAFAERPGKVLSKEDLLKTVWPGRRKQGHLVEVTVARLRDRLGPEFGPSVVSVRRRGYRLDAHTI